MLSRLASVVALVVAVTLLAGVSDTVKVRAGIVVPQGSDMPGDVNCDNEITPIDPLELLLGEADLPADDDCANGNSDLNCDQSADKADVPQILRLLAGLQPQECVEPGMAAEDLIEAALARGDIDSDTAILYKLYYLFGDQRLPPQFDVPRTNDAHGSSMLKRIAAQYDSLSPEMQTTVGPYLVPPYYVGSWWDLQQPGAAHASQSGPPCVPRPAPANCPGHPAWSSVSGTLVKIWYPSDFANGAAHALNTINDIEGDYWPKLQDLMHVTPISDAGQPNNGGDGLLDIAIIPGDFTMNFAESYTPNDCSATPSYIAIADEVASPIANEIMIHELMHAFQYAFDVEGSGICDEWDWVAEGTADWAVKYIRPTSTINHDDAEHFFDQMEFAVDEHLNRHEYGSWTFFYYLTQTNSADMIREIWEAGIFEPKSFVVMNGKIPGGWAETWPRFAAYVWNRPPYDYFNQWDNIDFQLNGIPHYEVKLTGGEGRFPGTETQGIGSPAPPLKYLAANYYHFTIDPEVRSLGIYNGLTNKLIEMDTDSGRLINIESYSDNEDLHISLIRKINGQWQEPIDWTYAPFQHFCLDVAAERVEEVVLVATNAEYEDRSAASTIRPEGLPVTAVASDIGCWKWEGTITQTFISDDGFHEVTELKNGVFERDPSQVGPYGGGYNVNYIMTGGGIDWEVSGTVGECTYSGSETGLRPPADRHSMGTINNFISGPYHRSANGSISIEELQPYTESCPGDPPEIINTTVGASFPFHEDGSPYFFEDGGVIDGTSAFGPWVVTYHLEARRE